MRIHKSVMLNETIDNLLFKNTGTFVDCTLGSGGHSLEVLKQLKEGTLIGLDSDIEAVNDFKKTLKSKGFQDKSEYFTKDKVKVYILQGNFSNIQEILQSLDIKQIDGIMADLGWSSDQLVQIEGLSYDSLEAELDMRLDKSLGVKAADLLNVLGQKGLATMFSKYADIYGKDNAFLVERIVDTRKTKPFKLVQDLLPILDKTARVPNLKSFYAKVFQALRIAVNAEYSNLENLLQESLKVLNPEGRVLIITFHSGEARIVEEFVKKNSLITIFNKRGETYLVPTIDELQENISSRSAKLFGYSLNS